MGSTPHISPRIRAYGKARIDITRRAKDEEEWRRLWKGPSQAYPFVYGEGWKFNVVYSVDDYAAEVGFFIDLLGFPVWSFSASNAQFTSPSGAFTFSVAAAQEGEKSTPPEALRLQFNLSELEESLGELEQRGVIFDQQPEAIQPGSTTHVAAFRTPHGVRIELWGEIAVDEDFVEVEQDLEIKENEEQNQETLDLLDSLYDETGNDSEAEDEEVGADEVANLEEDKIQPAASPPHLWQRFSNAVTSYKAPLPIRGKQGVSGKGNGELIYAPVEKEGLDLEDDELEEDFP